MPEFMTMAEVTALLRLTRRMTIGTARLGYLIGVAKVGILWPIENNAVSQRLEKPGEAQSVAAAPHVGRRT